MAIEGRIQKRGEALQIFLIDPYRNLLLRIFVVELTGVRDLCLDELAGVQHVQLNEFLLVVEAEVMEDVVVLLVEMEAGVELGVFFQEVLHLQDVGRGEDELRHLLFVHPIINLLLSILNNNLHTQKAPTGQNS